MRDGSPLAFPCGVAPGFDPTHPAAQGCFLSAIASGGSFVSLLNGGVGSVVAGGSPALPTPAIYGNGGPATGFSLASLATETSYVSFPTSPANSRVVTFAGVATTVVSAVVNGGGFASTNLTGSGSAAGFALSQQFSTSTSQLLSLHAPGVGAFPSSSFAMASGVPYFFFASGNSLTGVCNYVLLDLTTGILRAETQTTTAFTPVAPSGGTIIGNYPNGSAPATEFLGYIHAVHGANLFMSPQQGVQWASDFWPFWYPQKDESLVGSVVAAIALAARAQIAAIGRALATGKLPIAAKASIAIKAADSLSGATALAARTAAASTAKGTVAPAAALSAKAGIATKAKAVPVGVLPLAARAAVAITARATATVVGSLTALAGLVGIAVHVRGNLTGTVPLAGKATAAATVRGGISTVAALAALAARLGSVVQARAGLSGAVPLAGKAMASGHAVAPLAASAPMSALIGRIGAAVTERGVMVGRLPLVAVASIVSFARLATSGFASTALGRPLANTQTRVRLLASPPRNPEI